MAQDINNKKLTLFIGIRGGIANVLILISLLLIIVILGIPGYILDPYSGQETAFLGIMYAMLVAPVLGLIIIPFIQIVKAKKVFFLRGSVLLKLYFYNIVFAFFTLGIFYIITFLPSWIIYALTSDQSTSYFGFTLILGIILSYVLVMYLFLRISKIIKSMNLKNNQNDISLITSIVYTHYFI